MRFLWIALRALLYMAALVSLFGLVALSLRGMDAQLGVELPAGMRPMGAVFMVLGAALALSCGAVFVAHGEGTPAPFDPPRRFVAHGPYRWVRNPMIIGVVVLLVGFGLWNQSVSIVVFGVVVAVGIQLSNPGCGKGDRIVNQLNVDDHRLAVGGHDALGLS